MKLIEARSIAELEPFAGSWNSLLERSSANSFFLTWEWTKAWWSNYGVQGELWVLLAVSDGGQLLGVAPLRRKNITRYGRSAETIAFATDGSNDSEYLDLIVSPAHEADVRKLFRERLGNECAAGRILQLNEIPAGSATLAEFRQAATGTIWTERQTPCATAGLPPDWDQYLGTLKPRFRTKVRSVLRTLESRSDVQFGICRSMDDLSRLLPALFDLHARRWATEGKPGVFGWDQKRRFYREVSPLLLDAGWLRVTWLEWNGRILACQYGFLYNGTYLHLQEGYEPACEHWNSGIALRAWSIRHLIREGVREYDFLGGINRHKTDWAAVEKRSANVQAAAATAGNQLFCRAPEWVAKTRETVSQMLPEAVLELRRSRTAQKTLESSAAERWRQTAASLYVNSGFPALARKVREKYQLAMPQMRLRKRSEPSGRILYYHRVNEDNDPFFPAISTRLFEEEMQYLARHYRVVSLGQLLARLEDGTGGGDMVAVTFDDGYADNYTDAFPVLERLGLPATIFLTTGVIDSGEPMWFEVLAGALKVTARESVDLELDLPRRYWLRNQQERLAANDSIYGLLRQLPDHERSDWMRRITRELGVPAMKGSRMLTWDQIRHMKEGRIDFGGHTVNHPFLSRLPADQVLREVSDCKRRIEAELQQPVAHFAYPSGREEDFGQWNKSILREAGYRAAVTTIWGMNYPSTDRMELRRGGPWESTAAMFAYKLDWYQLVND